MDLFLLHVVLSFKTSLIYHFPFSANKHGLLQYLSATTFLLQVEVKKMCLFLPKTHLQLPDPSVNIPQNLHRLARSRSLPDTVVVCLPHVTIQSAGHKPVSPLQEIPISSMDGSLVGKIQIYCHVGHCGGHIA